MIVAAGLLFACTPVAVWDGDGPIWCSEGAKLRLQGIAARELNGTCRRGHPCPRASGIAARDALVQLLGGAAGRRSTGHIRVAGPKLRCRSAGPDAYGRTLARCALPGGRDLGGALVKRGMAKLWRRA